MSRNNRFSGGFDLKNKQLGSVQTSLFQLCAIYKDDSRDDLSSVYFQYICWKYFTPDCIFKVRWHMVCGIGKNPRQEFQEWISVTIFSLESWDILSHLVENAEATWNLGCVLCNSMSCILSLWRYLHRCLIGNYSLLLTVTRIPVIDIRIF